MRERFTAGPGQAGYDQRGEKSIAVRATRRLTDGRSSLSGRIHHACVAPTARQPHASTAADRPTSYTDKREGSNEPASRASLHRLAGSCPGCRFHRVQDRAPIPVHAVLRCELCMPPCGPFCAANWSG